MFGMMAPVCVNPLVQNAVSFLNMFIIHHVLVLSRKVPEWVRDILWMTHPPQAAIYLSVLDELIPLFRADGSRKPL